MEDKYILKLVEKTFPNLHNVEIKNVINGLGLVRVLYFTSNNKTTTISILDTWYKNTN